MLPEMYELIVYKKRPDEEVQFILAVAESTVWIVVNIPTRG